MVSLVLNNFISHLVEQDQENIPCILSICKQTIDRYKCTLDKDDKTDIDIKYPLTTLINVDKFNSKYYFQFVENIFETDDSISKIFIQKDNKLKEIGSVKNKNKFTISTKNEDFFIEIKDDEVESFKKERESSPFSVISNQDFSVGNKEYNSSLPSKSSEEKSEKKKTEYQEIESNVIELQSIFEWKYLWYPLIPIDNLTNQKFPIKECNICQVKLVPTNMRLRKLLSRQMYQGSKDYNKLHYKIDINNGIYFWENITKCQRCNLECQKGNLEKINESDTNFHSKTSSYNELSSFRGNDDNDDLTRFL